MGLKRKIVNIIAVCFLAWVTLRYLHWRDTSFDSEKHVRGKRVLVTGASSGIGKATALLFCKMGAHVAITARTASKLEKVIEECADVAGDVQMKRGYVAADMSNLEEAASVIPKAVDILGGIDYLILNHVMIDTAMLNFFNHNGSGYDTLRKMFDINYFSYVKMTDVAMPFLLESKGRVAVVNSVVGRHYDILSSMYGATKHAMDGFFQSLDLEHNFRETGVTFTVMMVGPVDTWKEKSQGMDEKEKDEKFKEMTKSFADLGIDVLKLFSRYGINPGTPEGCAEALIKATALRQVEGWYRNDIFQWGPIILKNVYPEMTRNLLGFARATKS